MLWALQVCLNSESEDFHDAWPWTSAIHKTMDCPREFYTWTISVAIPSTARAFISPRILFRECPHTEEGIYVITSSPYKDVRSIKEDAQPLFSCLADQSDTFHGYSIIFGPTFVHLLH